MAVENKQSGGCLVVVKALLLAGVGVVVLMVCVVIATSFIGGSEDSSPSTPSMQAKATPNGLLSNFNAALARNDLRAAKIVGTALTKRFAGSAEARSIADRMTQIDAELTRQAEAAAMADRKAREEAEAQAKRQLAGFRRERDEVNSITFYYPRSMSTNRVSNYFGLYLGVPDKGDPYLRFRFQYAADDWLFIRAITFNIDGERVPTIDLPSNSVQRDNSGGGIWEWHDEAVESGAQLAPFIRLATAKRVIVRYEGRQYYKDRDLSAREKKDMLEVMNVYASMRPKG